ncbi:zinc ribbon domain-containing protein [Selenomonas ruminantium]|uniref:zinc ribbon domain-containing protein n=1 Tax=Selenomonas ruminantium TaxID=971 RepID=UPI000478CC25|nr:zinc ribbon domain-containing protein [Selenomonas ruminantium]
MPNFCKNCGNKLTEEMKFCNKCGTPIIQDKNSEQTIVPSAQSIHQKNAPQNPQSNENLNIKQNRQSNNKHNDSGQTIIIGILALLVLLGGGGYYFYKNKAPSQNISTNSTVKNDSSKNVQTSNEQKIEDNKESEHPSIKSTKKELEKYGFTCNIVATSYGHNQNGFLAVDKRNDGFHIMIVDSKNKRVAEATPRMTLEKFYSMKDKKNPDPIIIEFLIFSDTRGNDAEYGEWRGSNHFFPIYALYKFDSNGNIIPGMLTSGKGANPSHFQGVLYEKRNVELTNLFLEEALTLYRNAAKNYINL